MFGYREMADIALAYRRAGNQARFKEAMIRLDEVTRLSLSDGVQGHSLIMSLAAYHAMAGAHDQALVRLAEAIDSGWITATKISKEYPYFRELDGNPEYEAIQARMIENINRERKQLDLLPVSASM